MTERQLLGLGLFLLFAFLYSAGTYLLIVVAPLRVRRWERTTANVIGWMLVATSVVSLILFYYSQW